MKEKRPKKDKPKPIKHVLYSDTLKDKQGFIRDLNYKPDKYDLIEMKLESGRSVFGWWNGKEWVSRRFRSDDKTVVGWKRRSTLIMS